MANQPQQLDTRIEIITPENIAFQYCVAGPFRRLPAYLIDVVIRLAVVFVMGVASRIVFGVLDMVQMSVGMLLITWFILDWFYGGLFEALWNGQTPGKRLLQLRVVTVEGQPIEGWQAILRNFLRVADSLPYYPVYLFDSSAILFYMPLYQLGLFAAAMNDRFQRLGDLASGTMVVAEEPQRAYGVLRINEPAALELAGRLPVHFTVSRSLGRALSAYVERRPSFPWRRRIEIALHLAEPLREKMGLPADTNPDLLLCALYQRTFIADRHEQELVTPIVVENQNPFAFARS